MEELTQMLTAKQTKTVSKLINTSASDCIITLETTTDMQVLTELKNKLTDMTGHATRLFAVDRRIRKLNK